MTSNWFFLNNVFLNVTKSSFKRMLLMARDHHDKLKIEAVANPAIDALYQAFLPPYTHFNTLYSGVTSNAGVYGGSTLSVENLLSELSSTKAKRWDVMIQNVYDDTSVPYRTLFGTGRAPFQNGAYDMRIAAIRSLSTNLGAYADLAAVKTNVDAFLLALDSARTAQQGSEKRDATLRADLEDARVALAIAMHRVFGGLIQLHADNTKRIETFYEMKYVQSPNRTASNSGNNGGNNGGGAATSVTVSAGSRAILLTGTYSDATSFVVNNTGTSPLGLFVSNDPQAITPSDMSYINAGEVSSFTGDELTDSSTPIKYLIAINETGATGMAEAWTE